jgi:DNA-binding Xre family transcriptional regulator
MNSIVLYYIPQGYILLRGSTDERVFMVRLQIHELLTTRRLSAYALSQGTDLPYPTAYRLSRPGGKFGRLHVDTLDRLCEFFRVQPGRLLEWVPSKAG